MKNMKKLWAALLALAMTFFVPQMFTGVAFDSGGVASGPMTTTFLLLWLWEPVRRWGETYSLTRLALWLWWP